MRIQCAPARRVVIVLALLVSIGSSAAAGSEIRWEPYAFETRSGRTVAGAERGRLSVPEDPRDPAGRQIELAMVRLPSTAAAPGYPIVVLGAPGDPAIEQVRAGLFALVDRLREFGDVIALDPRGSGLSEPGTECPDGIDLPADRVLDAKDRYARYREHLDACADGLRERGIDLAQYTALTSADDVEQLRRALGVAKIRLVGMHDGTHLALMAIRRYPDSFERVVLAGVQGPDHALDLPSALDAHLDGVSAMIARDPVAGPLLPDFGGLVRELVSTLERTPAVARIDDPRTGEEIEVAIGADDVRTLAAAAITHREIVAYIPHLFLPMRDGDFTAVAPFVLGMRRDRLSMATIAIEAASAASAERLARIEKERASSLLGSVLDYPFPELLEAAYVAPLAAEFREPVRSTVPTLFLSGTLDGRTPIENANEVRKGFPRSEHLVVDGAGHDDSLLVGSDEILDVVAAFFRTASPLKTRVALEPIDFVVPENASREDGDGDLVIANATVFDGTGAPPLADHAIWIRHGRIVRVGPTGNLGAPAAARVVDATGKFVIPGLWDMHVHLSKLRRPAIPLFVLHGVTSVRDMGGELAEIRRWQREIADDRLFGPRVLTAGGYLEAARNVERMLREDVVEPVERSRIGVRDAEHARDAVRELARQRVDHVKMRTFPSKEAYFALAEAAAAAGLPLVGHADGLTPEDVLRSGQRSIEHGFVPTLAARPPNEREVLFRRLAQRGVAIVPTLGAWEHSIFVSAEAAARTIAGDDQGRHGLRPYVSAFTIADWREQLAERASVSWDALRRLRAEIEDDVRAMRAAGATVLPGSDTAVLLLDPGASLHDELALLVERLGMSAAEALVAATRESAAFAGLDHESGTIAPGMRADLVLLEASPLDDIGNTRRIAAVVANGRFLGESERARILEEIARMPELTGNDWERPSRSFGPAGAAGDGEGR